MATIALRSILAAHANSLERLRRDRGLPRPVSVRVLLDAGLRFCDFPDPPGGIRLHTTAYTLKKHRRKLSLTWTRSGFMPLPLPVGLIPPGGILHQTLLNAFQVWTDALSGKLIFNYIKSPELPALPSPADITITFEDLIRADGSRRAGDTAADGTSIKFDTSTNWVAQNPTPPGGASLLAVATHEIGHAIGLLHSTSDGSVMFPLNANTERLTQDDINGALALYGWDGQQPIPDVGTDRGPALCACGPLLAMAWKGIDDDDRIYYATSMDGSTWTPQHAIEGVGTSDSPSLAWDGTLLWMAWKGIPGDSGLYFATTADPSSWPANPGQPIGNVGSSNAPYIAIIGSDPLLVWKGTGEESGIFSSIFNFSSSPPWRPQRPIPGIGTSDRPALVTDVSGEPLLVWKGIEDDSNLWASTKTGLFWQPQEAVAWIVPGNAESGTEEFAFPGAARGPGITTDGSRVLLVWRGAGDDQGIWFTQRAEDIIDGTRKKQWSSQGNIPGVGTSHRPAAAFFNGRLYVAYKGADDDHTIWMSRL
jgi:Matrixin